MKQAIIVALSVVGIILVVFVLDRFTHPGNVNGPSTWYQLRSTLPECSFDGTGFSETPCYAPPGVGYD